MLTKTRLPVSVVNQEGNPCAFGPYGYPCIRAKVTIEGTTGAHDVLALIDTGADISMISAEIVSQSGGRPIGSREFYTPDGRVSGETYRLYFWPGPGAVVAELEASRAESSHFMQTFGVVIGKDVLRHCALHLSENAQDCWLDYPAAPAP